MSPPTAHWHCFRHCPSASRPGFVSILLTLGLGILLGCAPRDRWTGVTLTRLDGRVVEPIPPPGTRAMVFVFIGAECPISNRAVPELTSLETEFGPKGFRFVHVYPFAEETVAMIREHRREYGLSGEAWRDPEFRLARRLGTSRTPEVVVVRPDGTTAYRGRINDQFAALGVSTPAPRHHDLAEALAALAAGRMPSPSTTQAVGCSFRSTTP